MQSLIDVFYTNYPQLALIGAGVFSWFKRNTWILPYVKQVWNWFINALPSTVIRQQLDEVLKIQREMSKELKTNGGSSLRDSVNRMETQMAILKKRSEYRDQRAEIPYFLIDETQRCVESNKLMQNMANFSANELLDFGWMNTCAPVEREFLIKELNVALAQGRDLHFRYKFRANDKENTEFMVELTGSAVVIRGKPLYWLCFLERKG